MLANENEYLLHDIRLIKRHLATGKLSKKELEQHLRSIEDASENMEIIPLDSLFDLPHESDEKESKQNQSKETTS